ncbi:AbrB/MazE/SpoVT family DNA-binding domain-containing protein [Candidatus Woesearchaeota archaeon]|nr:AbrB/MazE/SpoVT family DNA-binding domain-containing protein [Candidatus Woesearchaeota archaeon]
MKKEMRCACGKTAEYVEHMKFNNNDLDGWRCSCGEVYYNPQKVERILLLNKLKKQSFRLRLSQVRSNLILRIPKEVSDVLDLHKGCEVEFILKDRDKIVIHPIT